MSKNHRDTGQQKKDRARIKASRPNCHICGQAILFDADWLHPLSFVVDHVVPLAKGGADNLSNKAAAHRECNSKKRARLVAPIVRRSRSLE